MYLAIALQKHGCPADWPPRGYERNCRRKVREAPHDASAVERRPVDVDLAQPAAERRLRHRVGVLRHAVAAAEPFGRQTGLGEVIEELLDGLCADHLGTVHERAHARQIIPVANRVLHQREGEIRQPNQGAAMTLDRLRQGPRRLDPVLRRHGVERTSCQQRQDPTSDEPHVVKEGQPGRDPILGDIQPERRRVGIDEAKDLRMGERQSFLEPGRAGRVLEYSRCIRINSLLHIGEIHGLAEDVGSQEVNAADLQLVGKRSIDDDGTIGPNRANLAQRVRVARECMLEVRESEHGRNRADQHRAQMARNEVQPQRHGNQDASTDAETAPAVRSAPLLGPFEERAIGDVLIVEALLGTQDQPVVRARPHGDIHDAPNDIGRWRLILSRQINLRPQRFFHWPGIRSSQYRGSARAPSSALARRRQRVP